MSVSRDELDAALLLVLQKDERFRAATKTNDAATMKRAYATLELSVSTYHDLVLSAIQEPV